MTAATADRAPVSRRALIARIKRQLAKDGESLRSTRPGTRAAQLGAYYVINAQNSVVRSFDDLAAAAAEMGLIHPHERYDDSEG